MSNGELINYLLKSQLYTHDLRTDIRFLFTLCLPRQGIESERSNLAVDFSNHSVFRTSK